MKKEYAKHLSYKKTPLKVCKTMAKQNPEVCQIKYPKKTAGSVSNYESRYASLTLMIVMIDCCSLAARFD